MKTLLISLLFAGSLCAETVRETLNGSGTTQVESHAAVEKQVERYKNKPNFRRGASGGYKTEKTHYYWQEISYDTKRKN